MEEQLRELVGTMLHIGRKRRQIVESTMGDMRLTPSQHYVLYQIQREGRMPSQTQIASALNVSPASMARTVKSLDALGYICRSSCSSDGRRNEISITAKGEQALQQSRMLFKSLDEGSFAGFSEQELAQFSAMLQRILENLNHMEEGKRS